MAASSSKRARTEVPDEFERWSRDETQVLLLINSIDLTYCLGSKSCSAVEIESQSLKSQHKKDGKSSCPGKIRIKDGVLSIISAQSDSIAFTKRLVFQ
jgi:hypothetical protein